MSINKVILVGNVGKDPVIRYFDKGVAKVNFPLATSETYTNQQGETITSTEWHNIVLWRALAEVAEKTVKKGSQVYIVGKIKTRSYVDKDGINKYITEILADTLLLLEKKHGPGNTTVQAETGKNEVHDKGSSGSVINEPSAPYQPANENNNKNWPDKGSADSDDFGIDALHKNGPGTGQNEDDLPF
ncbi:MAG: single-stranded DNA-binding protein [Bacteroidia bacterium]|nr:single-stranded DNA-binding protein [Bacteroidia bacterium]